MGPGPAMLRRYLPWLILAGIGSVLEPCFSAVPASRSKSGFVFEALAFLALAAHAVSPTGRLPPTDGARPALCLWSLAPAGILGFSLMWTMTFGAAGPGSLSGLRCRPGRTLRDGPGSGGCIHAPRPAGSPSAGWAMADMLAGLLLVSLCAGPASRQHRRTGFPSRTRAHRLWRVADPARSGRLPVAHRTLRSGLDISLLRTRLQTATGILVALILFLLLGLTFVLPLWPRWTATRYIDYWFWAQSVALLSPRTGTAGHGDCRS